jgi:hypothetical protein
MEISPNGSHVVTAVIKNMGIPGERRMNLWAFCRTSCIKEMQAVRLYLGYRTKVNIDTIDINSFKNS